MPWFALVDDRIQQQSQFGHGDLFVDRAEADAALAEVLHDEPDLEPVLHVLELPLPEPSSN